MDANARSYRGRLAPSPTGLLHVGHARTFWIAAQRTLQHCGALILRNEDLDLQRCRPEFVEAIYEDLGWLSIRWTEGPDCGGPYAPYLQSQRRDYYLKAWRKLRDGGFIYPCTCSRKDVALAAAAPNNDVDDEPLYPGKCRTRTDAAKFESPAGVNCAFVCRMKKRFRLSICVLERGATLPGETLEIFLYGGAMMSRRISWPWLWMMRRWLSPKLSVERIC